MLLLLQILLAPPVALLFALTYLGMAAALLFVPAGIALTVWGMIRARRREPRGFDVVMLEKSDRDS